MKILFFDTVCPQPYDSLTLETVAQGGTESTVTRVAEALAKLPEYTVDVAQKGRLHEGRWNAHYVPLNKLRDDYDRIVLLRDPRPLVWAKKKYPKAKLYLWAHDENYDLMLEASDLIRETGAEIIGVSRYHQSMIYNTFLTELPKPLPKIKFIYNPIPDLKPRLEVPKNFNFIYFSSPHKGLELTLEQFNKIKEHTAEATLLLANPGYYTESRKLPSGVYDVGSISHDAVMDHVRSCWAVLHCNSVFPETFGLVHAEANAMGVPVITGGLGANREVLDPYQDQCIDITKTDQILAKVEQWKRQYPTVKGKVAFTLTSVIKEWEKVLS